MRKTILVAAVLIVAPAFAQDVEHAPTAAQCQADSALWQSQAADFFRAGNPHDTNNTVIAKMTARQLQARANELGDCMKVDPTNATDYSGTQDNYMLLFLARAFAFVQRHNLSNQFYQEDEAGAR